MDAIKLNGNLDRTEPGADLGENLLDDVESFSFDIQLLLTLETLWVQFRGGFNRAGGTQQGHLNFSFSKSLLSINSFVHVAKRSAYYTQMEISPGKFRFKSERSSIFYPTPLDIFGFNGALSTEVTTKVLIR
jgi:hypothetical protein